MIRKLKDPADQSADAAVDLQRWAELNQLRPMLLSHIAFVDLKARVIYCSEIVLPSNRVGAAVYGRDFPMHNLVAEHDDDRLLVERVYHLVVDPPASILEP